MKYHTTVRRAAYYVFFSGYVIHADIKNVTQSQKHVHVWTPHASFVLGYCLFGLVCAVG